MRTTQRFGRPCRAPRCPELVHGVREYCWRHWAAQQLSASVTTGCTECREFLRRCAEFGPPIRARANSEPRRAGQPRVALDIDGMWAWVYAFEDWVDHMAAAFADSLRCSTGGRGPGSHLRGVPDWALAALRTTTPGAWHGSVNCVAHVLRVHPRTLRRRIAEFYGDR